MQKIPAVCLLSLCLTLCLTAPVLGKGSFAEGRPLENTASISLRFEQALSLYKEGIDLFKGGSYDACIVKLKSAIALYEKAEFYQGLGIALARQGNLAEAEQAFRRAIALAPQNYGLWSNLGRVLFGLGKDEEARAAMNYAIENHGGCAAQSQSFPAGGGFMPATTLLFPAGGNTACSSLLSLPPKSENEAAALAEQAASYTGARAQAQAQAAAAETTPAETAPEEAFDALIASAPESPATSLPSRDFPGKGEYKDWAKASRFYNLGNALRKAGRFDEAVEQYRLAINTYPYDADFFHNLGLALKKKGDFGGAEKAYRQALSLSGQDWDSWYNLGSVLYELKRFKDARAAFLTASSFNPATNGKNSIEWYLEQMSGTLE